PPDQLLGSPRLVGRLSWVRKNPLTFEPAEEQRFHKAEFFGLRLDKVFGLVELLLIGAFERGHGYLHRWAQGEKAIHSWGTAGTGWAACATATSACTEASVCNAR